MCKVLRVIQVAWRRARGGKKNGVRATAHPRRYGIYWRSPRREQRCKITWELHTESGAYIWWDLGDRRGARKGAPLERSRPCWEMRVATDQIWPLRNDLIWEGTGIFSVGPAAPRRPVLVAVPQRLDMRLLGRMGGCCNGLVAVRSLFCECALGERFSILEGLRFPLIVWSLIFRTWEWLYCFIY